MSTSTTNTPFNSVYISGPMTGYEDYNYPAFNELERKIKELYPHVQVTNPTSTGVVEGFEWRDYLITDLKLLLDAKPDVIVTLPDWERSRGAKLEVHVAKELGIHELSEDNFFKAMRNCVFKNPAVIYRKSDFGIYRVSNAECVNVCIEDAEYNELSDEEYKDYVDGKLKLVDEKGESKNLGSLLIPEGLLFEELSFTPFGLLVPTEYHNQTLEDWVKETLENRAKTSK